VNRNGILCFVEKHAIASYPKAEESFELAAVWLDVARPCFGVAVNGMQYAKCRCPLNATNFSLYT
jgi:hypothetical protein